MKKATIKIQSLNAPESGLVELDDLALQSISGRGPIGALAVGAGTAFGIAIDGLVNNKPTEKILEQELIYAVPAAAVVFLLPEP